MQKIYRQDSLSVDDKIELAKLMDKMYGICEARQAGIYTRDEQATFIDKLSESEAPRRILCKRISTNSRISRYQCA